MNRQDAKNDMNTLCKGLIMVPLKLVAALVLAFFGIVGVFKEEMVSSYRTVEVSPGILEERWASSGEIWFDRITGGVLCALSGVLLRRAYARGKRIWQDTP
jgi:hypothetical protein